MLSVNLGTTNTSVERGSVDEAGVSEESDSDGDGPEYKSDGEKSPITMRKQERAIETTHEATTNFEVVQEESDMSGFLYKSGKLQSANSRSGTLFYMGQSFPIMQILVSQRKAILTWQSVEK